MNAPMPVVRVPLWRGSQMVSALWFENCWLSHQQRLQRMLQAWRPGSQALRFGDGDLLRFPAPLRADCAELSGLALCLLDCGLLSSAPLGDDELDRFRRFDVVLVVGARQQGLRFADAAPIDVSASLELGDYTLHDTFDCSAKLPPLALPELAGKSVREALGDRIPPASADRDRMLQELANRAKRRTPLAGGGAARGMAILDRLLQWLKSDSKGALDSNQVQPRRAPTPPSHLRAALTRLAIATRASVLLGWRQSAYLRRMMKHFDDGDLSEALRHALPIDSRDAFQGQEFGLPGRRNDLRLGASNGVALAIDIDEALTVHLRSMYRRSFERLDREARIDEAAFVLGELLNARKECLDYLEKHRRYAQAAELALAWEMPAATAVRLLILANDWQRAIQVARRDGAFADVLKALEQAQPTEARKLRILWGEWLADCGEWIAAMDAVWPVAEARSLALGWLRIAEQGGEILSARALIRRAQYLPDTLERYGPSIRQLARLDGEPAVLDAAAAARSAIADSLLTVRQRTPALAAIANALLPALAADRAAGRNQLGKSKLNQLLSLGGDPYLKADLPAWQLPALRERSSFWSRMEVLQLSAPAAGLVPVFDAAPLAERRYLLALGEAGVVLTDAQGRVQQRYSTPADSLVIADNGLVALAVAKRESRSRISRLDLVRQTSTDLGSLKVDMHASQFDGSAWRIVADDRILVLDTAKSLREVIWHVGDLPGAVVSAQFGRDHESYLIGTQHGTELWSYVLPSRRLVHRSIVEIDPQKPTALLLGRVCQLAIESTDGDECVLRYGSYRVNVIRPTAETDKTFLACCDAEPGLVLGLLSLASSMLVMCRPDNGQQMATMEWPAGAVPRFQVRGNHLMFFDAAGRVLDIRTDHESITAFSVC